MKNKKAQTSETGEEGMAPEWVLKIALWIFVLAICSLGLYFLLKYLTSF
ncbi:MAG: hypothetical protein Q8N99_04140 [Nanoarchaeota archaeon]|nr:hypothetical protein [Nanoarchaeota archaeon]